MSVQVVQSNETKGSYHMELEGLKMCHKEVSIFNIHAIVMDRHRQISKWIRESWQIPHYFDCWHIVKGMGKNLQLLQRKNHLLYSTSGLQA